MTSTGSTDPSDVPAGSTPETTAHASDAPVDAAAVDDVDDVNAVDDVAPVAPAAAEATTGEPTSEELARATPAVVRRAPRYRAFVLAGVVVGAAVATVLVLVRPAVDGAALGTGSMWLVLAGSLGGIGALLGALVVVVVDRRSRVRADRAAGRPTGRRRRRPRG